MSMELKQLEDRSVVRLTDSIVLGCSAELHKLLVEAVNSKQSIGIDLQGATELDIAGIQLLCAAWQAAERNGISLSLEGSMPDVVKLAFREAGLDPFHANGLVSNREAG